MTAYPGSLLLLDTNVLVHLIRNDAIGQQLNDAYGLLDRSDRPLYSTVTEGEVLALARSWGWGEAKRSALGNLLGELVRVDSSLPIVVSTYAEIYDEQRRAGRPLGENDTWIAATAIAVGADLMTNDSDFDRLVSNRARICRPPHV